MARLKEAIEHEMDREEWRKFVTMRTFSKHYEVPGGGQIISVFEPYKTRGHIEMPAMSDRVYINSYDAGLSSRIRRYQSSQRRKLKKREL